MIRVVVKRETSPCRHTSGNLLLLYQTPRRHTHFKTLLAPLLPHSTASNTNVGIFTCAALLTSYPARIPYFPVERWPNTCYVPAPSLYTTFPLHRACATLAHTFAAYVTPWQNTYFLVERHPTWYTGLHYRLRCHRRCGVTRRRGLLT